MEENKMTAETALLVLAVGARVSKDEVIAEKASSLEAIIRIELAELQAELKSANETIERERSLRSDVIAQRDAFRAELDILRFGNGQTPNDTIKCFNTPMQKIDGDTSWRWAHFHPFEGFDCGYDSKEMADEYMRPEFVADGWRVVPVKIVKVGEAQRNSSETMRDEN